MTDPRTRQWQAGWARRGVMPLAVALLVGCASSGHTGGRGRSTAAQGPLPADYVPVRVGAGRAYRPAPSTLAVRTRAAVGALSCSSRLGERYDAHLEIFVRQHVVAIPAGIGITPPLRFGASQRIIAGRCFYAAVTLDPTGVIELTPRRAHTLGQLFAIWGQPLTRRRLLGFAIPPDGLVSAYVGIKRWRKNPSLIPLRRHTRVVLELLSRIPPHRAYAFPPGQ